MKILHILTLLTPDGSYGGPARVAVNQAAELRERGHDVVIACGASGFDRRPDEVEGIPVVSFDARRLIPGVGFASTWAARMNRWLSQNLHQFDAVHVHLARDLVTGPAAALVRRRGIPYVVQTHGMITPRSHPLAGVYDRVWTTELLRHASAVLHLNDVERGDVAAVGGAAVKFHKLPNGVPLPGEIGAGPDKGERPEVLFFARLHPRKRPELFAEAALSLLIAGTRARFAIVGPAEGSEVAVDAVLHRAAELGFTSADLVRSPGVAPEQAAERISRASVYVLPAEREPFGMTIVEALAVGVPVVICDDGGLADFVRRHGCGIVVDDSLGSVASAISVLVGNPDEARRMGRRGAAAVRDELSIGRVVGDLEQIYCSMIVSAQ